MNGILSKSTKTWTDPFNPKSKSTKTWTDPFNPNPSNALNQTTAQQGFGPTLFKGTLNKPARVTINKQHAHVSSTDGAAPYTFEALVHLAQGDQTVTIEATDGNGNSASNAYSVVVGGLQKTLHYDLNGNLNSQRSPDGTVLQAYQWDAKNRLVKILEGTQETEFAYDGKDRRVLKIERTHGSEISRTHYIWDGSNIVQSRAADASTLQRNYFQQGIQENAQNYYYTKDHLGSIREVVASDGITIEAAYDYSPWGQVTKIAGTGVESDFLYTGHFYHSESDLHLTLYRAYNPKLGMWLSRDPIAENGGINLYAYVGNYPVNYWDPLGLKNAAMTLGGRMITGGLITTQADSPAPGPADAIGLGVAATGAAIWGVGKLWDWAFNSDKADDPGPPTECMVTNLLKSHQAQKMEKLEIQMVKEEADLIKMEMCGLQLDMEVEHMEVPTGMYNIPTEDTRMFTLEESVDEKYSNNRRS